MKKISLLFMILLLSACTYQNKKEIDNTGIDIVPENEEIEVDTYVDDNPIKVGLYLNGNLVKDYKTSPFQNHKDIVVFDIYYTDTPHVDSVNTKYNFNKYYQEYENIDNYKIGFYISFEAEGKKIEQVILGPNEKHSMTPYLYNYLYDDVHQADGAWYSHIEPEDMKDNTVFSSIKIYSAQEGSKMSSPISVTVFTYDGDEDFDENGHYRGNSYYTATISVE